ncbi:MAG: hypothetical protein HKN41_12335, partial [Ilumatobacter sp.]|nr:hypothetical protein [Ilumatobacter sp.]
MSSDPSREQTDGELIDATVDAVNETMPIGLEPGQMLAAAGRLAQTTAAQPGVFLRRAAKLAAEQVKIVAGTSEIAPGPKDRRFTDDAWHENPFFKRLAQSYLALDEQV